MMLAIIGVREKRLSPLPDSLKTGELAVSVEAMGCIPITRRLTTIGNEPNRQPGKASSCGKLLQKAARNLRYSKHWMNFAGGVLRMRPRLPITAQLSKIGRRCFQETLFITKKATQYSSKPFREPGKERPLGAVNPATTRHGRNGRSRAARYQHRTKGRDYKRRMGSATKLRGARIPHRPGLRTNIVSSTAKHMSKVAGPDKPACRNCGVMGDANFFASSGGETEHRDAVARLGADSEAQTRMVKTQRLANLGLVAWPSASRSSARPACTSICGSVAECKDAEERSPAMGTFDSSIAGSNPAAATITNQPLIL
jgi:hypothetical protein